jgi:hypothetical protein
MFHSVKGLAAELNVPEKAARALINQRRIAFVPVSKKKVIISDEAIKEFIATQTVTPCRDGTKARASASSTSVDVITSSGQKSVAAASAARALAITERPKKSSASSSSRGTAKPGHVIPLKRS